MSEPRPVPSQPAPGAAAPGPRPHRLPGDPLEPPDPRRRAPRSIVAALIGAEAGAGVGLLGFGGRPLVPLGMAAAGALAGALVLLWLGALRRQLFRSAVRRQLRDAR